MSCLEFEVFASAICDGENVPRDAADHIFDCGDCRSKMKAYSELGAEIRLAASLQPELPLDGGLLFAAARATKSDRWAFLWHRMPVPRHALLTLLCSLVVSLALNSLVRAQSKPMWFLFGLSADGGAPLSWIAAENGYNDQTVLTRSGPMNAIAIRVSVTRVAEAGVSLRAKARRYTDFYEAQGQTLPLKDGVNITFVPGRDADIPVEGGGTVRLVGRVADHQPRIAWGQPLELEPNQFIVRSPVLIGGSERIGDLQGATAVATPTANVCG